MSNRFYYGMPGTQAFQAMNALDDDVQAKSAAAAAAALAAASSAAQAGSARDAALAAWQASTAPNEQLAALSKQFHGGAVVDVFLYDTGKDSDGGAWRMRCNHTSWENEPLVSGKWLGLQASLSVAQAIGGANGDYYQSGVDGRFYIIGTGETFRGNTRQFPALTLIVIEASRVVIYDATNAALPMWMVFTNGTNWNTAVLIGNNNTCVTALNGAIYVGTGANTAGVVAISFLTDHSVAFTSTGNYGGRDRLGLVSRNSAGHTFAAGGATASGVAQIVNNTVNDVDVTVLPDAPVDPAAGLPVPSIAVATAGGVSVIKHDGSVVNSGSNAPIDTVEITGRGNISLMYYGHSAQTMPISQLTAGFETGASGAGQYDAMIVNGVPFSSGFRYVQNPLGSMEKIARHAAAGQDGLLRFKRGNTAEKTMVAAITNAYNSGWQVGDARGAWLADTVVESIAGQNLMPNGDFSTGDVSAYAPVHYCVLSVLSGQLRATKTGTNYYGEFFFPSNIFVPGKTYSLSINYTGGNYDHQVGIFQADGGAGKYLVPLSNGARAITTTFVANGHIIGVVFAGATDTTYAEFDNLVISLADPDRSVKGNALTVNGSIAKTAVANGAQAVGYSGFSASNYLEQLYSPYLDFGTGDFCMMGWLNIATAPATVSIIASRIASDMTGAGFEIFVDENLKLEIATTAAGFSTASAVLSAASIPANTPVFATFTRRSGVLEVWINGVKDTQTAASTDNISSVTATLRFGVRQDSSFPFNGWLSMWRMSASVPTVDQIAQIYRDELSLFQAGAQCTIDGISTAVTALAHDDTTDLLHIGTSWGRSSFHGLQRTESAATQIGAVTALSAARGAHLTGGAGGARLKQPALVLRDELRRKEVRGAGARDAAPFDFDSTAGMTDFTLPPGWRVKEVLVAGVMKRLGATKDYVVSFDGYRDTVRFAASPGAAWVQVMASRSDPG